jgi:hypothetical protein
MPRFSLKRLFASITLIAIGVAMIAAVFQHREIFEWYTALLFVVAGGGTIGAGLFNPFRRPWLGVAIGILAVLAFLIATARLGVVY